MIIPIECKRLAEVDFPISEVSKHAAREKSIRHGHPSTLHLWWARRPLASSRAVLMALMLPDPLDALCPENFKIKARELLEQVQKPGPSDTDLRTALLKFVGDFANWSLAANQQYLKVARGLIRAAYPDETPLIVDPFAGGGSIPLEALRLGCDAFASDLNPVAGLIQKVMLEDIPRFGGQKIKVKTKKGEVEADGLAEALLLAGSEIKNSVSKELAQYYPTDPDGSNPMAYLWARTVRCESPNCGAEIPLMRSLWLSKKANRRRALRPTVIREVGKSPQVEFEIFTPTSEAEVIAGNIKRANATCFCCQKILPAPRVRASLRIQSGGGDVLFDNDGLRLSGARLLAVVTLNDGMTGRQYRLPTEHDYRAVWQAKKQIELIAATTMSNGLTALPNEPTPTGGGSGAGRAFSVQNYGMMRFRDMFTARQNLALFTFAKYISQQDSLARPLSLAFGKLIDLSNIICPWEPNAECPRNVLSLGRIKTAWDFAEGVPISESSGSFSVCLDNLANGVASTRGIETTATCEIASAQKSPLASESCHVWFTDPPYYDAIPYSDLSDMFFVWYKRALPKEIILRDPFDKTNLLTPKDLEATQDEGRSVNGRVKDKKFFEDTMGEAFYEGYRVLREDGIGCVIFAHKTTEGWEALLTGMIRGKLVITGSWPIATEMAHRPRARDSAALSTSIHLVCRPRSDDASIGDWTIVSRELPRKVGDWMHRLQNEGVSGADLVFACIGPALEIYSRYSKVVDAQDREIPLGGDPEANEPFQRGYLAYVWETVGRLALEQVLGSAEAQARNDNAGALEEDARLTALFLWTLKSATPGNDKSAKAEPEENETDEEVDDEKPRKSKAGFKLIYDVARRFAQPLGIHLDQWEGRIIETEKGVVRLIPITERARQLFGEEGAQAFVNELERNPSRPAQLNLFSEIEAAPSLKPARASRADHAKPGAAVTRHAATTLDRLHAAMLLQKNGQATALHAMLQEELERSGDFLRLANSLSALYPRESEEKRLLDAMLVNVKR